MADARVAAKMLDGAGCPMMQPGDRIVMEGDEVLKRQSSRICARAVAAMTAAIECESGRLRQPGAQMSEQVPTCATGSPGRTRRKADSGATIGAEFACSAPRGCRARFVLEEAPAAEAAPVRRLEAAAAGGADERPFLARLPVDFVKELVRRCRVMRFDGPATVVREGERGRAVYFVGEGEVEVVKEGESSDVVLATLAKGSCFGEMSLLTGAPTSATVRTKGRGAVFELAGDELERLISEYPALAREFSRLLAERLRTTSGSLERELDRGILGRLSMISAVDLIQTLNASRRSGDLTLTWGERQCVLGFRNGEIASARMGSVEGEEAFFELLRWPDGDFCFEQSPPGKDVTPAGGLRKSTTALLMEGLRRIDESARGGE